MKSRLIHNLFGVLCLTVIIHAQPLQAEGLRDALITAWRTNPQLLAAWQSFHSGSADVQTAFSEWLPQADLKLEYGINRSSNVLADGKNLSSKLNPWSMALTVKQNIFRGGQIIANVSQARSAREAVFGDLLSAEQNILLSAATAYFNLMRDLAIVELNENNLSIFRKKLVETRNRFQVGEGTRTLVAFAEAGVSAAQTLLASARAQKVASQAAYRKVIGRDPIGRLSFPPLPKLPKNIATARSFALKNHPALKTARQYFNIASSAKTAAYGLFLPTISVEGRYMRGDELSTQTNEITNLSVTGRVSVPLYKGGSSFASVRKAAHEARRAHFSLLDTTRQIDENLANAWQGLIRARAQIKSATEEVRARKIALSGIRQQERLGTSTFLDSLDAEQDYLNAKVQLASARRDEHVLAYNLLASIGLLNAKNLNLSK